MTGDTTQRTSASQALTDWQQAVHEIEQAGQQLSIHHTRENKQALRAAQAKADRLLREYHNARMLTYEAALKGQKR